MPQTFAGDEPTQAAGTNRLDTCEMHEIPSSTIGATAKCLVFVPKELDLKSPLPLLVVFPDPKSEMQTVAKRWGEGDVPECDSMLLAVPEISPGLPEESYFALFSEIMHALKQEYTIDNNKLFLWGIGRGYRQAFFAARALPDKFAAIVGPEQTPAPQMGLLEFARLSRDLKAVAIRRDPHTYRDNLRNMKRIAQQESIDSLHSLDSKQWSAIAKELKTATKSDQSRRTKNYFRTDRLRFNNCGLGRILAFKQWGLTGAFEIEKISAPNQPSRLMCRTENIDTLAIEIPADIVSLIVDDQRFEPNPGQTITLEYANHGWRQVDHPAVVVTRKYPDRAGPLSDTLFTPFVFVYGTQGENEIKLKEWAINTAESFPTSNIRVLSDNEVLNDEEFSAQHSLVCFGDRSENAISARTAKKGRISNEMFTDSEQDLVYARLHPSPFSVDRYTIVLEANSEKAFQAAAKLDWNADWVIYNTASQKAVRLGSFNADWELDPLPPNPWSSGNL